MVSNLPPPRPFAMSITFKVARNPDPSSRLPYLVRLPIDGGIVLKAREVWPRLARVYCSHEETPWDESAGLVDEVVVLVCHRRGAAIDLVVDRPQLTRSQFVFTTARGRPVVWWRTQKIRWLAKIRRGVVLPVPRRRGRRLRPRAVGNIRHEIVRRSDF
jgi:hypothetical protein